MGPPRVDGMELGQTAKTGRNAEGGIVAGGPKADRGAWDVPIFDLSGCPMVGMARGMVYRHFWPYGGGWVV